MPALVVVLAAASFPGPAMFHPFTVDSSALAPSRELANALVQDGIVQVIGIPGYKELRLMVLSRAKECNEFPESHKFSDGTTRRSIASHTVPGPGGEQPFPLGSDCHALEAVLAPFRSTVKQATGHFALALSDLLDVEKPLLSTPDGLHHFTSFFDVVEAGDHLEHIHEYVRPQSIEPQQHNLDTPTLDMHVDQGIFIAFTPALELTPSDFYLKRRNGETVRVAFDPDALVFMMGGGAEQIIMPKLLRQRLVPYGAPHAVTIPPSDAPRMWYGRMVLPPPGAALASDARITYGKLREEMIRATSSEGGVDESVEGISVACLQPSLNAANRRALDATSCSAGSEYCWHRCMELSPDLASDTHEATNAIAAEWMRSNNSTDPAAACASQGLALQCVDPRDMITIGGHGDFYPACTNTTQPWTPYPIAATPRNEAMCTDAELEARTSAFSNQYSASADLMAECGESSGLFSTVCRQGVLQWNLANSKVDVRVTFNGQLGWAGLGIANPGGGNNGMMGAHIAMLLPGPASLFTAKDGLTDTSSPVIDEFIINEFGGSAFRLWQTSYVNKSITSAGWDVDECFTSFSFSTDALAGWPLNTVGTDQMIWAFNSEDHFVGYHGSSHRGLIQVRWAEGLPSDEAAGPSNDIPSGALAAIITLAVVMAVLLVLLVAALWLACRLAASADTKPARAERA